MSAPPNLAALVADHHADVWRYLRFLGCDASTADDLTQETFLKLVGGAFEERDPRSTAAYLRSVARNLFRMSIRSSRNVTSLADLDLADAAWEQAEAVAQGEERRRALGECMRALGERARQALHHQYSEHRSGREIASLLGISHENLRVVLHRAKQALRKCVQRKLGLST